MSEIDWPKIAKCLPKTDTRIQASDLPDQEYWLLKAGTAAQNRRLSQNAQALLVEQVQNYASIWIAEISFLATQEGCSFEEKFVQLALEGGKRLRGKQKQQT